MLRNFILITAAAVLALGGHADIPVFRDGRVALPVLVSSYAAPEERAAAEELARVLSVMSGLVWPMREASSAEVAGFYVGRYPGAVTGLAPLKLAGDMLAPHAGEIGPDGFRIWSDRDRVFIEGATPEATAYAVSWLLQNYADVRWYDREPTGEIIPRREQWSLPDLQIVREPGYLSREIFGLVGPAGVVWARRNGLRGRFEFTHGLTTVFSPAVLAAHPEWAPLVRGQRHVPKSAADYNWQPNLALPEVAAYAGQQAAEALAADPARASFSLGINDSMRFDQSPATRTVVEPLRYFRGKPDYAPLVFTFMNRAAETLSRTQPDRYLGCLAYFWGENVPPFPVHPQVLPYVTTDRSQYYDAAYRAADEDLMSRWGASGVRAFGLWEYGYGQSFLVPRVPHRALAAAIREGWHRGARGYFAEMLPHEGFDVFKVWLVAQLLWNPDRSYEELADDFFHGYYGAAAVSMRRFFERCEEQWMTQPGPPYWLKFYQQEDQAQLFPAEVRRELRALLVEAAQAEKASSPAAQRIARTSVAFAVTEAYGDFYDQRRVLAALPAPKISCSPMTEAFVTETIRSLPEARRRLDEALAQAQSGESPAMMPTKLPPFVRNDPVPRLLWLAGQQDSLAPQRLLATVGREAATESAWWALAEALARGSFLTAPNLAVNSAFAQVATDRMEPRFLHAATEVLPTDWEVRQMSTATSKVTLGGVGLSDGQRSLRIDGAWDTQVYQWRPAEPGRIYLATARLRGHSSLGNDAALFLSFLSKDNQPLGTQRMQALAKGQTEEWWTVALADCAPADTAWVGIGVGASRQVAGDWLEVQALELRRAAHDGGSVP